MAKRTLDVSNSVDVTNPHKKRKIEQKPKIGPQKPKFVEDDDEIQEDDEEDDDDIINDEIHQADDEEEEIASNDDNNDEEDDEDDEDEEDDETPKSPSKSSKIDSDGSDEETANIDGSASNIVSLKDILSIIGSDDTDSTEKPKDNEKEKEKEKREDLLETTDTRLEKQLNLDQLKQISRNQEKGISNSMLDQKSIERAERRQAFDVLDNNVEKYIPIVNFVQEARRVPVIYQGSSMKTHEISGDNLTPITNLEKELKKALDNKKKIVRSMDSGEKPKNEDESDDESEDDASGKGLKGKVVNAIATQDGGISGRKARLSKSELVKKASELSRRREEMQKQVTKMMRLKKIKSKAYRRILKKERKHKEALEMEDPNALTREELEEKLVNAEKEFIKERVTLRRKNTGLWAKRAIPRMKFDSSLRQAVTEQITLHNELKDKQNKLSSLLARREESDDEERIVDEMFENDNNEDKQKKVLDSLKDEIEQDRKSSSEINEGIFGMQFMKKARDDKFQQQKKILADIAKDLEKDRKRSVNSDSEAENSDEDSDKKEEPAAGKRTFGHNFETIGDEFKKSGKKTEKTEKMSDILNKISSVTEVTVSKPSDVDVEMEENETKKPKEKKNSKIDAKIQTTPNSASNSSILKGSQSSSKLENDKTQEKPENTKNTKEMHEQEEKVDQDFTELLTKGKQATKSKQEELLEKTKFTEEQKKFYNTMKQEAFSGDNLELEFEKQKDEEIKSQIDITADDFTVARQPGWGSWAGL